MTGIYFLKQGEKVVYVGQSVNIENRVKQHTDKEFDSYHYIECSNDLLDSTELAFITLYQPIYNKNGISSQMIKTYLEETSNDFVMYRIDKKVYKQLQQLKLDMDAPTINAVIAELVKKEKESRK